MSTAASRRASKDETVKYIVVRGPDGDAAILFPRSFMHRWVAEIHKPLETIAAGFVKSSGGQLQCYGASSSLKLSSRPGLDSDLVNRALEGG